MMQFYKIFTISFLTFSFVYGSFSFDEPLAIISRSQWGANEEYRYRDGAEWKALIEKWDNTPVKVLSEAEKLTQEKSKKRIASINKYLVENYPDENTLRSKITTENTRTLAWAIEKSSFIKGIVIHHTETEAKNSIEGMRSIYKYHALTRAWGDIGYNYIIGYDGEVFEGRAGGDYVVGAHALYNNRSTLGIAIMGNMENHDITEAQLLSLQKLILFLTKKYGIDLNKKIDYHKECKGNKCNGVMNSSSVFPIIGHKDVGFTACPGEYLYQRLDQLTEYLAGDTKGYTMIKNTNIFQEASPLLSKNFDTLSEQALIDLLAKVESGIDSASDAKKTALKKIRISLFSSLKKKQTKKGILSGKSYEDTHAIKVKLSYPLTGNIDITNGFQSIHGELSGTGILVDGVLQKSFFLKSGKLGYVTLSSWERIPTWDTKKIYNDNTFRGTIFVTIQDGKLLVINQVKLGDYLKGLGEISEGEQTEKARTIIIAARTYARYYMGNIRKYPGEPYDASDNPDEFQRYLGYGLESRSPSLSRIVIETKNMYISYAGNIIKPWYFSSSNGKTLSFYDYCIQGNQDKIRCREAASKYPYLNSVDDFGGVGNLKLGHGVGISGVGISYFAQRQWTAEMIIQYYLKGTKIAYK